MTRAEEIEVVEALTGNDRVNLNRQENNVLSDHIILNSLSENNSQSVSTAQYKTSGLRGYPLSSPLTRGNYPNRPHHNVAYHGPPPPLPNKSQPQQEIADKRFITTSDSFNELWPSPNLDKSQIISLDVKCEKNFMKVFLGFDKPFYGIIFSKGHYSNVNCIYLPAGLGRTSIHFEISIHACGTAGNTENGLYGYGAESGSGTYFENIIVVQYDPQVQEVWDQARKLRCTWHDLYEKSVTFRPFPVDMLDVVRADFAGDNVGCWMQIQVGKGPWASEVSGLVKIGQTMTMVLAIKDDDSKFDMLVRNCMAHDGKRAPIQLVDQKGCITRPKLISRFTKIKNFGASASVLSYAHFQAFKFPDSMEVHFQCTIQICRYHCPEQCSASNTQDGGPLTLENHQADGKYDIPSLPSEIYLQTGAGRPRDERRRKSRDAENSIARAVGINKIIKVVSSGDLTFTINTDKETAETNEATFVFPVNDASQVTSLICMTTFGFAIALMVLLVVMLISCALSAYFWIRLRPFYRKGCIIATSLSTPKIKQKNSYFVS